MLLSIAGIVLIFAAVNLGSLVIVRVEAARSELGVKLALGAPRSRLIGESVLQGVLLGAAGAAGAVVFAAVASREIAAFLLRDYLVPTSLDVAPDRLVIGFTILACCGIGGSMCALVTWWVTRGASAALTTGGTRSVTRAARTGRLLVAAQAAVAIVLLTNASLLGRNLYNLGTRRDIGSGHVLVGSPSPRVGAYKDLDPEAYYRDALAKIRAVPGVEAAAFSQYRPARGAVTPDVAGRAGTPAGTDDISVEAAIVSPGFFDTIGLPLLQGRDFDFNDGPRGAPVAIVSRRVAERLFGPGRGPGERIRVASTPQLQDLLVVGIATDAAVFDVRRGTDSIVYLPALQRGQLAHYKFLVIRGPAAVVPAVARALASLGRESLEGVTTLEYVRGRTLMQERVLAAVGGYFGLLALVLTAAGVHGLVSVRAVAAAARDRDPHGARRGRGTDWIRRAHQQPSGSCRGADRRTARRDPGSQRDPERARRHATLRPGGHRRRESRPDRGRLARVAVAGPASCAHRAARRAAARVSPLSPFRRDWLGSHARHRLGVGRRAGRASVWRRIPSETGLVRDDVRFRPWVLLDRLDDLRHLGARLVEDRASTRASHPHSRTVTWRELNGPGALRFLVRAEDMRTLTLGGPAAAPRAASVGRVAHLRELGKARGARAAARGAVPRRLRTHLLPRSLVRRPAPHADRSRDDRPRSRSAIGSS